MENKRLAGRLTALIALFFGGVAMMFASETDTVLRPVTAAYTVEVGTAHLCDTYLTPLHYSGWTTGLSYERLQAMRHNPRRNVMRLDMGVALSRTLNPAGTALMWQLDFRAGWSMMWRYRPLPGLTLAGGGNAAARAGALALMRNSNNPVSAKAAVNIGLTGMAVWNGSVAQVPVTLRYQPTLPVAGVFFSPEYDELYYEIWLGNHSGLCHFAWPASYFALDNLLTADIHLGATTLRLGYRCDYRSSKAADIVSRSITHTFVLGIATEWITLRAGTTRTPDAAIVSALY